MISKYFTEKEALYLPQWDVLHIPSPQELKNIKKLALIMDSIRDFFNHTLVVHCWIRPVLNNPSSSWHGQDYNTYVKGALHSAHKIGLAVDYHVEGLDCQDAKKFLIPKLDYFNIRLENNGLGNWLHNDIIPPHPSRYFIP